MDNLRKYLSENTNKTFKLTKIGVKNSDSKHVQLGDKTKGGAILAGDRLVCGDIVTSVIQKVTPLVNNNFLIETTYSIYTLENV